jgi:hypothetical protein
MLMFVTCHLIAAQRSIFDLSNFTIPFPASFDCPATRNSAALALPAMTWCGADNPFILSDFLSRNSTDLTSRHLSTTTLVTDDDSSDGFHLHIQCGGVPLTDASNKAFVD